MLGSSSRLKRTSASLQMKPQWIGDSAAGLKFIAARNGTTAAATTFTCDEIILVDDRFCRQPAGSAMLVFASKRTGLD
jgi:hypothetical protein